MMTETPNSGRIAPDDSRKAANNTPNRPVPKKYLPKGMEILYEDSDVIVVSKDAGLLTIAAAKSDRGTAQSILGDYVKKGNVKSKNRVFVVHRLDQATSGVLMFAKNEPAKLFLQENWKDTTKKYLAVVHGHFEQKQGCISSYLAENKALVVYSTKDTSKGKIAHTVYRVIKEAGMFSLVEITLLTGRKNQIRVHLADEGHPVVGDKKYGKAKDGYNKLALHSQSIAFTHPTNGRELTVEAQMPGFFNTIMRQQKEKAKEAKQKSAIPNALKEETNSDCVI